MKKIMVQNIDPNSGSVIIKYHGLDIKLNTNEAIELVKRIKNDKKKPFEGLKPFTLRCEFNSLTKKEKEDLLDILSDISKIK